MTDRQARCERVQTYASLWLDGELDAERRGAIDAHLSRCDACHEFFAELKELGFLTRSIDEEPLPDGFAARVREAAEAGAGGRSWIHDPVFGRVAAGLVILLSVAVAYRLGHEQGARDGAIESIEPINGTELTPIGYDQGLRAARSLMDDVDAIDRVPEGLRRPLLRAQLDHFELPAWARRVHADAGIGAGGVTELADFVHHVERMLEDDLASPVDLKRHVDVHRLRVPAGAASVHVRVGRDSEGRQRRRSRVLTAVASDLPTHVRATLDRVLHMNDAMVFGVDAPEMMELAIPNVFGHGNPFEIDVNGGEIPADALRKRLEAMFGGLRGSGEIVVEEESGNGVYSYRVILKSGSKEKRDGPDR